LKILVAYRFPVFVGTLGGERTVVRNMEILDIAFFLQCVPGLRSLNDVDRFHFSLLFANSCY